MAAGSTVRCVPSRRSFGATATDVIREAFAGGQPSGPMVTAIAGSPLERSIENASTRGAVLATFAVFVRHVGAAYFDRSEVGMK